MLRSVTSFLLFALFVCESYAVSICIEDDAHPAVISAAQILADKLSLDKTAIRRGKPSSGDIVLRVAKADGVIFDGYSVRTEGGMRIVSGARPRSLLYAAYEPQRWYGSDERIVRNPEVKTRIVNYGASRHSLEEWLAATGCNLLHGGRGGAVTLEKSMPEVFAQLPEARQNALRKARKSFEENVVREVRRARKADVDVYPLLYGCDPLKWSSELTEAFLKAHPSAKGVDPGRSWEKGVLCPSDPATWKFFSSYISEFAENYDGVIVTFWDNYGLYCNCGRCRKIGMNSFSAQVAKIVKCYEDALKARGKKLIVRTWASGAPHFLNGEWVHAPGYAGEADAMNTWGKAFEASSGDTIFQTKVYNSDCQPNPPFSNLLGEAKNRTEIAEWQITGQTVGLQWLPASVVDHTAWTMKKALGLVSRDGGVCLYAGGYNNPGYEALDDVMNSVNIHVWRQLSWNRNDDVDGLWMEWAKPIYGAAAREVADALKETERITVQDFSPLGLGAPTESRFAGAVARREDLLRYTNRQYLPEGQRALLPTKENIARVAEEKDDSLGRIGRMSALIASAEKKGLAGELVRELKLRTHWLRSFTLCTKALDESLWRYRYLRNLSEMATTDLQEFDEIGKSYELLKKESANLFAHDADFKFSFYPNGLGEREITLRSPIPLMRDIYSNAVERVEIVHGPIGR